ncbi:hypothetical protein [Drosophila suzukii associated hytrosavirus 1]|nr:hypothetical protein [Drosophila suzukii associated hytrosavirus 1]
MSSTWSYSYFMYLLRQPFETELNNWYSLIKLSENEVNTLLKRILLHCNKLEEQMKLTNVKLRPNRMFIHCVDINYEYPNDYNFIDECRKFIMSAGIIVFDHLNNFEVIKHFLIMFRQTLSKAQHPLTGDTLWHLNPFTIDMLQAEIFNIYNFRGETPNERRLLAELLNFPPSRRFPLDHENTWDMTTMVYMDPDCDNDREPLALCKYIKKNKP